MQNEEWWKEFENHIDTEAGKVIQKAIRYGELKAWKEAQDKYAEHLKMMANIFGRSIESGSYSQMVKEKIKSLSNSQEKE